MNVYEVGGAVRDDLLETKSNDRDWVVIGSSPEEMTQQGFKPIWKDFPVFLHPETKEEYALARTEKKSGHGYHGFNFYFGKDVTLEEDLSRRDFTINAIAKDSEGNLIDPHNGIQDIQDKVFRHVSDSFLEDPLRAIRLARFKTYDHLKDFTINANTEKLLNKIVESGEINILSENRIWAETERALSSNNPNIFFETLLTFGMHIFHFKGLDKTKCDSSNTPSVRWAELQINNNFVLGQNIPVPNNYENAAKILEKLSVIEGDASYKNILMVIQNIRFVQNEELIRDIILLPNLKKTKNLILRLLETIKETDFSVLSQVPKEHIEEEKIKLHDQIIKISKWIKQF